jgi:hypothetical protein
MDLETDDGAAMAVGGKAVELAGTAIGAVAVGKFMRPDGPFCPGHGDPPSTLKCYRN